MKLIVVSDGTHEGTHLADAATGQKITLEGAEVRLHVHYKTPTKTWETPPEGEIRGLRSHSGEPILVFRETRPGVPAAPVTQAKVEIRLTADVEAPEGTAPFTIDGKF